MGTAIGLAGLFIIGFVAVGIWLVTQRGLELRRLCEDGADAEGTVIRRSRSRPRGPQKTTDHFTSYR